MVAQMHLLLPEEYCDTFEPLCMQAPKTAFEQVKQIVESELGQPLEEVFECKLENIQFIMMSVVFLM